MTNEDIKLGLALAGLAAVGVALTISCMPKKQPNLTNFEKALKNAGVELKNDIAIIKETGELFTGKIKSHTKDAHNEITKYVNGVITEKLTYDSKHHKENGHFYIDGKERLHIYRTGTKWGYLENNSKGDNICMADGIIDLDKSIFDIARNMVKKMKG